MRYIKLLMLAAAALSLLLLAACAPNGPGNEPAIPTQDALSPTETPVPTAVLTPEPTEAPTAAPTEAPAPTESGAEVSFYSSRFEKDYRDQIGRKDGPIYEADVLNTKSLEFSDRRLYELRDLLMFKNLESLTLQNTDVDDLSVLSEMQSLKKLVITSNDYLRDLSPIASLTGLREINLGGQFTPIEDLTLFSGMTELESLRASPLISTDLSPIANLKKLKTLILANLGLSEGFSDISVLAGLKELELINLGGTFSDISPLAELHELKDLVIYCSVSDVTPLSGLTKLTRLSINSDRLTDISVFAGFDNLTEIHMPNNEVEDITPIAGLTKLTWIELEQNNVSDISALSELKQLQDLRMSDNRITDITALYELTRLKFVFLSGNEIPREQKAALRQKLPNCGIYFGDDDDY